MADSPLEPVFKPLTDPSITRSRLHLCGIRFYGLVRVSKAACVFLCAVLHAWGNMLLAGFPPMHKWTSSPFRLDQTMLVLDWELFVEPNVEARGRIRGCLI